MRKYFFHYTCIILAAGCIFSSCTSTNEARKFSHLDYVKKDRVHASASPNSEAQDEMGYLDTGKNPHSLQKANKDYSASVEKAPNLMSAQKHHYSEERSSKSSAHSPNVSPNYKDNVKESKKEQKVLEENKASANKESPRSQDFFQNREALMWAWIACLVIGMLIFIIAVAASAPGVYLIAIPFYVGAAVFGVFWIMALVNGY